MTEAIKIWRRARTNYQYLGKVGRVESLTQIFQAPVGFERMAPYWVGVVRFRGGKKITGQLVEGGELTTGSKVVGVLRRLREGDGSSVIEYGVKFKKIKNQK